MRLEFMFGNAHAVMIGELKYLIFLMTCVSIKIINMVENHRVELARKKGNKLFSIVVPL